MAVVIETTLGDITVDLFLKERPRSCLNFLKLCKMKYYNYNLFHTISRGFIAQTGDPTGSRSGGESVFGVLEGPLKRFFAAETNPQIKHTIMGLVSFVGNEDNMIGSQFFFTLGDELTYLDGKHCVFGQVTEGLDVLEVINEAICDSNERPYQDIRITHTVILYDPLPDLNRMLVPSRSPSPSAERLQGGRIAPDEEIDDTAYKSVDEINEIIAEREAKARATILEMVGDLPDAEMAPPENVLFVCKLNPVTTDDDLEIIFSRFGKIKSCEVIRDHKTGDSLQYAFVEFENQKSCEDAYFKMDNVLIDDRRIHVDFSQSVSKVKWMGKGRGVRHFKDEDTKKYFRNVNNQKIRKNEEYSESNYSHRKKPYRYHERSHSKSPQRRKKPSSREHSMSPSPSRKKNGRNRDRSSSLSPHRRENHRKPDYLVSKSPHRRREHRNRERSVSTSPLNRRKYKRQQRSISKSPPKRKNPKHRSRSVSRSPSKSKHTKSHKRSISRSPGRKKNRDRSYSTSPSRKESRKKHSRDVSRSPDRKKHSKKYKRSISRSPSRNKKDHGSKRRS